MRRPVSPLSLGDIINRRREISQEEKLELATSVIEKNPFRIDSVGDYELYNAYSNGTYGIYNKRNGYESLLRDQDLHKKRAAVGIKENDPLTPTDVIKKSEERLGELRKMAEGAESNRHKAYSERDTRRELFSLYGFALNAKENGDNETFEAVKALINRFGSF